MTTDSLFDSARTSRRGLLRLAAGAAALGLAGPFPNPALAAAPDLKGPDLKGTVLRLADYKGLDATTLGAAGLRETPYTLNVAEFASGNLIVEALNAGSIDIGSSSEIPPAFGAAAGAQIAIVAIIKDDVNWQVVLVPPDSAIRGIADLKGKRVGYVRSTTTQYYLTKMLGEVNLSFKDITPVALTPAEGQAAFEQGSLDAWAIYGYSVPQAIKKGARVLKTSAGYLSGNYLFLANPDSLKDPRKVAAAEDFFLRLRRAFQWREANLKTWTEVHSAAIGVPFELDHEVQTKASRRRDLAPITDADVASAQNVADTFHQLGVLPKRVDIAPYFDRRFNDVLSQPLG